MEPSAQAAAQHVIALAALRRAREVYVAARVPMDRPAEWTAAQRTAVADYAREWTRFAVASTTLAVADGVDPWRRR